MAARAAAGERGRDGGQATRGGLRGALERLSPRQSREPKGAPNKIRMPHETKQGRPASLAGSRSSSSAGVGAEPPGAGGGLGAAEAQERVASALCEAVRRAVREELREQARETTCAPGRRSLGGVAGAAGLAVLEQLAAGHAAGRLARRRCAGVWLQAHPRRGSDRV
ncbi:unnamed protein product [Prorocentrum cordatum]|uniref:Uncharacterized protein n=1 Tax=Prorocentrum cordatum TaxID=2364126 RepID=A0ABN9VTF0_9DINO|nr:unnamed protein product [Polarella glacialis]